MTPTERIATALLEWEANDSSEYLASRQPTDAKSYKRWTNGCSWWYTSDYGTPGFWAAFPDFATLDGCRLFENVLVDRDLLAEYAKHLSSLLTGLDYTIGYNQTPSWQWCLMAPPAQRVAACLKVLDEAGL